MIEVFPRNLISEDKLQRFIACLSGNLNIDDQIFVSFDNDKIPMQELKVHSHLLSSNLESLVCLRDLFEEEAAMSLPLSMEACHDLSLIATSGDDRLRLAALGHNDVDYEKTKNICGLKWVDLFDIFPSLSNQVTMEFLLCSMKKNHVRSYSVSSCKVCKYYSVYTFILFTLRSFSYYESWRLHHC